jgi:hypothetical protein
MTPHVDTTAAVDKDTQVATERQRELDCRHKVVDGDGCGWSMDGHLKAVSKRRCTSGRLDGDGGSSCTNEGAH